jgi:hypothetical protein
MKSTIFAAFSLYAIALLTPALAWGYTYCGVHDRRHEMRAYYFNSEFWVDMLAQEERKWNRVYSVLNINRERSATFPAGLGDGQNVIGWLGETDLMRIYNRSWGNALAITFTRKEKNCGRILETDLIFNPAITQFTPQTEVPYVQGFQEAALHELGHVLTLGHEERGLALMAVAPAVSDVLHHNEKVGWYRSASQGFNPGPSVMNDMGVFPLRKGDGAEVYASLSPEFVSRGASVTISDFSVENLSSEEPFSQPGPRYRVVLENVDSGVPIEIGWFAWETFNPFSSWSGSLTFRVPANVPPATYRVVAVFDGQDDDRTNDQAVFGTIDVQ